MYNHAAPVDHLKVAEALAMEGCHVWFAAEIVVESHEDAGV